MSKLLNLLKILLSKLFKIYQNKNLALWVGLQKKKLAPNMATMDLLFYIINLWMLDLSAKTKYYLLYKLLNKCSKIFIFILKGKILCKIV